MKAKVMVDPDGTQRASIDNRGFSPVLLLEFIASKKGWLPVQVITGDDNFLVNFPTHKDKNLLVELCDYINANY